MPFFVTLQEVYEKLVIQGETGDSISMEHEVFAIMLTKCTSIWDVFKLYDLSMPLSLPDGLIVDGNSTCFLHLDCL
jgi:hypothetical protein